MENYSDTYSWAVQEFGAADLGDARRTQRLVTIAAGVSQQPGSALSLACGKGKAASISRLLGRPEVTLDTVVAPHKEQTVQRCASYGRIYAVQDTTVLNYQDHEALEGLGHTTAREKAAGILLHSLLAVTPDRMPLGVLGAVAWTRSLDEYGISNQRSQRSLAEKESNKWLWGLQQAGQVLAEHPQVVVVGDRESDVFALLSAPRPRHVELLIRATQNRILAEMGQPKLKDKLATAEVFGRYTLSVPRQGSRKAREAALVVTVLPVSISPPATWKSTVVPPVSLTALWAREENAPAGVKGLDWLLLTTLKVKTLDDARECLAGYSVRWVIEEYHRVLKSRCRVERMQFETLDRMYPAIGLSVVVAWRVLYLSKYARLLPAADAGMVASAPEIAVLQQWLRSRDTHWRIRTVADFTRGIAILGGFMGRKRDGLPGAKTLSEGLEHFHSLMEGFLLAQQMMNSSAFQEM